LGDEVVIIGRQGAEEVTADELAATLGTITYEIVTAIAHRVRASRCEPPSTTGSSVIAHARLFMPMPTRALSRCLLVILLGLLATVRGSAATDTDTPTVPVAASNGARSGPRRAAFVSRCPARRSSTRVRT